MATACEMCQRTEAPPVPLWMAASALVMAMLAPRPPRHARMISEIGRGWSQTMKAATGYREPTWYEKHREAYARTGDPAELARMLRHVDAG